MQFPGIRLPDSYDDTSFVPPEVDNPDESMAWAKHAHFRAIANGLTPLEQFLKLISNRILSSSEAFAGVVSGVTSDRCIEHGAGEATQI